MTRYRRTKAQIEARDGEEWFAVSQRFTRTRAMANQRQIVWEILIDDYRRILTLPCAYGGKSAADGIRINLDRLNNDLGYTLNNIVPACWFHNFQRSSNWTHAAFLDIMAHYPTPCRNRLTKKEKWANPFVPEQNICE